MRVPAYFRQALLVLAGAWTPTSESAAAPVRLPSTLKPETVAAWKKAGARFGYMRAHDAGGIAFESDEFKPNCFDLPAFAMEWEDFLHCAGLPEPEVPFGLLLAPREFDYTGKRPPPRKPPPGLVDIDVSNLRRVRYLSVSSGEGADFIPLVHGMQRLQQLEMLQLSVGVEFLNKLGNSPRLPNLKDMLVACPLTEEYLSVVGGLKQVTNLRLSGDSSSEGAPFLRHLAGHPTLRTLYMRFCRGLTDDELTQAAKIPELRELNISECPKITAKGLNALAGAKKLEVLIADHGPATDGDWTEAGELTTLRFLRVGGRAVTDAGLKQAAALPNLRILNVFGCDAVTDAGFIHIAAHKKLVTLGFDFNPQLAEQAMKAIASMKELSYLRLNYSPKLRNDHLNHLIGHPELRELRLNGCGAITDDGIRIVARLDKLERMQLWSCPGITEKCIPAVSSLHNLEALEFYESKSVQPSDDDMVTLGKMRRFRCLNGLCCERVTTVGYRAIASLPELEELGLRDCQAMTDGDLKLLASPGRLKSLSLSMAPRLTDRGLRELHHLPLRYFWLGGCESVSEQGILALKAAKPYSRVDIRPDWKPYPYRPPTSKK